MNTIPTAPLRIAVFGATGHIGSAVCVEAVGRGHQVTALARHAPEATTPKGTTAVRVDVLDPLAVADVVAGHDAVVAALAGRDPGAARTVPEAARLLLTVLPGVGVKRLIFIGGGASLRDPSGRRFLDDPNLPEQYRPEAAAAAEALEIFRASDSTLDWTYLSPPPMHLVDGDKTGRYRSQPGDRPVADAGGESRITLGDLAAAAIDAAESDNFRRQRFTVGY